MLPVMERWKKQGEVLFTLLLHRLSLLHAFQFVLHLMVYLHRYWLLFCPHPSQIIAPGPLSRLELWCCSRYNRWWLVRSFQTRSWIYTTGNNISCEHSQLSSSCLLPVGCYVENPCDWSLHYFLLIAVIAELCCVLQFVFFSVIAKLKSHHLYHQ